jgi:hypothetical protein
MREPLRTLLMQAAKQAGNYEERALAYVEEEMTLADLDDASRFFAWLREHGLTFGHGTIDLRFEEFTTGRAPMSQEAAYQYAMRKERMTP